MPDKSVFEYLLLHQKAFNERLHLIPSENSLSISARIVFLTDILNRYYFPLIKGGAAFPGNEFTEKIYERCRELLMEITGAKFVNIKPISGLNAMTVALAALARGGDTIATVAPENGGHTLTAKIARRLGIRVVHLPYNQEEFGADVNALPDFFARERPAMVYLDQQHILFPHRLKEICQAAPETTKIYYDGSHVMGLIFGKQFQDPFGEGADFLAGSTHKTLPGPHKAFIATNNPELHEQVRIMSNAFISHDHGADVAALAIVLEEMRGKWPEYAERVIENAQYFARRLAEKGFSIFASKLGFTRSHQVWIDIASLTEPHDAALTLARCNIIVNTYKLSALCDRFALRLGVQEITHLGAGRSEMDELADIFEKIFITKDDSEEKIKRRVAELKKRLLPPINREWLEKTLEKLYGR